MSVIASWLMLVAIGASILFWHSKHRASPETLPVLIGAIVGAVLGSKICFIFAEGAVLITDPLWLQKIVVGKTILGGLLGGYLGVEIAKYLIGYKTITGDLFAQMAPLSIALGRIGCVVNRCCPGKICEPAWYTVVHADGTVHWPAAEVEFLFNIIAAGVFFILRRKKIFTGQHFHIYMITYGLFRFVHEWLRAETHVTDDLTGYQILALILFAAGLLLFVRRKKQEMS